MTASAALRANLQALRTDMAQPQRCGEMMRRQILGWRREIDTLLRSLPDEPASEGWQPIATAPKDGTEFIARNGRRTLVCFWHRLDDRHGFFDVTGIKLKTLKAEPFTHWMPLPPAPLQEGQ